MIVRGLTLTTFVSLCALTGVLVLCGSSAQAAPVPGLEGEAITAVRSDAVTFDATIDPNGVPTSYYFQYGPTNEYGSEAPAAPGAAIGSGEEGLEVTQHVQGLQAGTTYHYRVVAVGELSPGEFESFYGPDQAFITQSAGMPFRLLDGREWEMVSPPDKHGSELGHISNGDYLLQASANGDAIVDWATAPTEADAAGSANTVAVFAGRGPDGWSSRDISPAHDSAPGVSIGNGSEFRFFSEDLSRSVVEPFEEEFTPLSPEATEPTAYLRTNYLNGRPSEACTADCYRPLVDPTDVPPGTQYGGENTAGECEGFICGPRFEGASPDASHIVLASHAQLTSASNGGYGLYEWAAGELQLVSVLPEDETAEGGGTTALEPGLGESGESEGSARNAISGDGSRIIWKGNLGQYKRDHLYLRDMAAGETVRLDLPQPSSLPRGPYEYEPIFATASADGSRVFFLDAERLTEDSTDDESGEPDLYEYNLNAPLGSRLTDLTVDSNAGEHADVRFVLGASEDGSYLYFASPAKLAPGATPGKCGGNTPQPWETQPCNLYVYHDGVTTFIAGLSPYDFPDWSGNLTDATDRVSPDGLWLAFMSDRDLAGYDTTDAVTKQPDEEVYLYDASTGSLVCASCNPTGSRPVGIEYNSDVRHIVLAAGEFANGQGIAANVPPWTGFHLNASRHQSRYLFDGGRLFFNSSDALVPQDVDGTEDVYEYEPEDVGSCTSSSEAFSERSGGCVGLVSSGTSNEESVFLDASESGGDVFFWTTAALVAQDVDNVPDIYDAHECAAQSPCTALPPVPPPPCSTGDSCKPAPSPQPPIFGAPASATFSGAGNIVPSGSQPVTTPKKLTRAQKLARALRGCVTKHGRGRRATCERKVKKRYGPAASRANATQASGR
jgi:hypothetical protein